MSGVDVESLTMVLQTGVIARSWVRRFGRRMSGVSPGSWWRVRSVMMAVSGVALSIIL